MCVIKSRLPGQSLHGQYAFPSSDRDKERIQMLQLKSIDIEKTKIETLIIPVCENGNIHSDRTVSSLAKHALKLKEFKGEEKDRLILYDLSMTNAKRVIFLGLGKKQKTTMDSLRSLAGQAVNACITMKLDQAVMAVPAETGFKITEEEIVESMMEGAFLANHFFDRYKKEKKQKQLKSIVFPVSSEAMRKRWRKTATRVETICRGTILAREWVNTPSNDKTPDKLVKSITPLARKEKLKITVFGKKELQQHKMGAILAVGQGSQNPPKMLILDYDPGKVKKTVAFVGKGVTFDSGGINIKPTNGLADMKADMAGAAAVAGALIAVARLKPNCRVVGLIPMVENMPSGSATRPGDIIRTHNGKTVEIGNTDAEGRLILVDALSYAIKKYKPRAIIDMATLTGACVVALGEKIAGVFTPDQKLAEKIIQSGEKTFERCWQMPLPEDYGELLKSELADVNNMSNSRWGGAITAAIFLSKFVNKTTWAHIDIAGPSFLKKGGAYCGPGATGFGVRLLCDLLGKL